MLRTRNRKRRGGAMLEMALFSPWIIFLFIGALDWGFYAYSMIALETATRSAAVYTSGGFPSDSSGACTKIVLPEMKSMPNIGSGITSCDSSPLIVTATQITGPDNTTASQVSVTYTTPMLIPIPGLLAKQFTITRVVTMKV
jgi:Flp pilus assembly protein TadG